MLQLLSSLKVTVWSIPRACPLHCPQGCTKHYNPGKKYQALSYNHIPRRLLFVTCNVRISATNLVSYPTLLYPGSRLNPLLHRRFCSKFPVLTSRLGLEIVRNTSSIPIDPSHSSLSTAARMCTQPDAP